jgi:hypothetical protein
MVPPKNDPEEIVEGDKPNGEGKYLAIKNWHKYQPDIIEHPQWIRDWVNKELDSEYSRLTYCQRYVLDALCRLRGRIGRNIPNDSRYIVHALSTQRPDLVRAASVLRRLHEAGFLLLTDQQIDSVEERRGEKKREEEKQAVSFSSKTDENDTASGVRENLEAPAASAPSKPIHFTGQKLTITKSNHLAFQTAFEGTDLETEYRRMDAWLVTNKRNYRDFGRFANSWLSRTKIPADAKEQRHVKTAKERMEAYYERKRQSDGQ